MSFITADARARPDAKRMLLDAARQVLLDHGFAGLSTRAVAAEAGTQMSQIRYHFGSKEGMVLALFEDMNENLVARQSETFANPDLSLAQKWALSCDYLEEDLASGYVRVLQELIAVGWSNAAIGDAVRHALGQWRDLLEDLARQFERRHGRLGPFTAEDVAALVSAAFIGTEAFILLGHDNDRNSARQALRRFGELIGHHETQARKD